MIGDTLRQAWQRLLGWLDFPSSVTDDEPTSCHACGAAITPGQGLREAPWRAYCNEECQMLDQTERPF